MFAHFKYFSECNHLQRVGVLAAFSVLLCFFGLFLSPWHWTSTSRVSKWHGLYHTIIFCGKLTATKVNALQMVVTLRAEGFTFCFVKQNSVFTFACNVEKNVLQWSHNTGQYTKEKKLKLYTTFYREIQVYVSCILFLW